MVQTLAVLVALAVSPAETASGERSQAVADQLRAASSPSAVARRSAYASLAKLGHVHPMPQLSGLAAGELGERCVRIEADVACSDRPVFACVLRTRSPSSGNCVQIYDTSLAIGRREEDIRACQSVEGSSVPVGCPALVVFQLQQLTEDCQHAGYPPAPAATGPTLAGFPAPQVVFVDGCSGRVGYTLSGRADEAQLAPPSRPVLSYLRVAAPVAKPAPDLPATLDAAVADDKAVRLKAYQRLVSLGVTLSLPEAIGDGTFCTPFRAWCASPRGGAEKVLYACLQRRSFAELLLFSRQPLGEGAPTFPRIGPFSLTTPGPHDPPLVPRQTLVFADPCAGRLGVSDGSSAREETLVAQ